MPSYQNVTPPLALSSGDVGFSFNNEAFPGGAQSGTQFALPSFSVSLRAKNSGVGRPA